MPLGVFCWWNEGAIFVYTLLWGEFGGMIACVCIWHWYGGVIVGAWYVYFGGIFPDIGDFNSILCKVGLNGVGIYMCVSCLVQDLF